MDFIFIVLIIIAAIFAIVVSYKLGYLQKIDDNKVGYLVVSKQDGLYLSLQDEAIIDIIENSEYVMLKVIKKEDK